MLKITYNVLNAFSPGRRVNPLKFGGRLKSGLPSEHVVDHMGKCDKMGAVQMRRLGKHVALSHWSCISVENATRSGWKPWAFPVPVEIADFVLPAGKEQMFNVVQANGKAHKIAALPSLCRRDLFPLWRLWDSG